MDDKEEEDEKKEEEGEVRCKISRPYILPPRPATDP